MNCDKSEDILHLRYVPLDQAVEEIREYLKNAPDDVDYDDIINDTKIWIPIVMKACNVLREEGFLE